MADTKKYYDVESFTLSISNEDAEDAIIEMVISNNDGKYKFSGEIRNRKWETLKNNYPQTNGLSEEVSKRLYKKGYDIFFTELFGGCNGLFDKQYFGIMYNTVPEFKHGWEDAKNKYLCMSAEEKRKLFR